MNRLKEEFINAPRWQKILLVFLFGYLFYYFVLRIGFIALNEQVNQLDKVRDQSFRKLQRAIQSQDARSQ